MRFSSLLLSALILSGVTLGCDDGTPNGTDAGVTRTVVSTGAWTVYADPFADGGANPVPSGVTGTVTAREFSTGKTEVVLNVANLPPNRTFGSHVHKLACDDNKAGGHYQHDAGTDPSFATATNEIWLDFTTTDGGMGTATATVDFKVRPGEGKAVMIHANATGAGGAAGAKLACTPIAF